MPSWATVGTIAAVYGVDTYVRDMKRIASETARTGLAVTAATRAMNGNVFSGIGRSLASVGSQISRIGNNISSLGFAWTSTFGAMAAIGVGSAVSLGREFEKTMLKIQHLTNASAKEMEYWTQTLLRMAPQVGKTPQELAEALYYIKSIPFLDAAEEADVLTYSAYASALGLGDMGEVAKSVVGILRVYGDSGMDAREATNGLLVSTRIAAFEAEGLSTAMARVLPYAKLTAVDFAEAAGFLAAFSQNGATAQMAATSLINTLNFIADPTEEANKKLDEYGWTIERVRDSIAGPNGLAGTLDILGDTMGMDITGLFTTRATSGVAAVSDIDEYRQIVESIRMATNLAEGQISELELAFQSYQKSAEFAFEATVAGLHSVAISLYQSFKAPMAGVLLQLRDFLVTLQELIYNNPQLTMLMIKLLAAIVALGPALIVVGTLIRSIGNIVTLLSVPFSLFGAGLGLVARGAGIAASALAGPLVYSIAAASNIARNSATTFSLFFRSLLTGRGLTATLTQSFAHLARMIAGITTIDYARNRFLLFGRSIITVNLLFIRLLGTISTFGFAVPTLIRRATTSLALLRAGVTAAGGVFPWLLSRAINTFGRIISVGGIIRPLSRIWVAALGNMGAAIQRLGRSFILVSNIIGAFARYGISVIMLLPMGATSAAFRIRMIFAAMLHILTRTFGNAFLLIGGMMTSLRLPFAMVVGGIMSSLRGMATGVTGLFAGLAARISAAVGGIVLSAMTRMVGFFAVPLAMLMRSVAATVLSIGATVVGAVVQSILALIPVIVSAVGTAIGALAGLGAAIFSIVSPIVAVGAAIAGAILLITSIAGAVKNMFGRIRTVANRETPTLAGDMRGYGRNIIESFSRGMIDGLIAVVQALRYIASVVRAWLRPGSPPKILPDLDIWGAGAMASYMEGWTNIDFSAFSEISSKFRAFFSSLLDFDAGPAEEAGVIGQLIGFRDILAKAINDIDAVGYVSDSIWNSVNAGLTGASLEMQNYVRLTLQAAEAQERVKDIQEQIARVQEASAARLKPLNDRLAEIAGIREEVSGEDRIEELERIIANPRSSERTRMLARLEIEEIGINQEIDAIEAETNPQLEALNAQLAEAQAQSEILAMQAENAQAILELQIEQNELLREQLRLLEEAEKKESDSGSDDAGEEGGAGGGLGEAFPELPPAGMLPEDGEFGMDFGDPTGGLDMKLQELKDEVGGLMGELGGLFSEIKTRLSDWWYGTGKPIFEEVVNHPFVQEIWTTLRDTVGRVVERFNEMKPSLDSVKGGLSSLTPIVQGIGLVILALVSGLSGFIVNLAGIFGSVMTRLTELKPAIDQIVLGIGNMIRGLMLLFGGGEGGWELLGQGFVEFISGIGLMLEGLILAVLDIGARIGTALILLLIDIGLRLLTGFEEMTGISTEKIRLWLEDKKAKLEEFLTYGGNWGTELKNRVVAAWEELRSNVAAKIESMRSTVEEKTSGIRGLFIRVEERLAGTREKFRELQEKVSNFITLLTALILEKFLGVDVKAKDLGSTIDVLRVGFEEFKRLVGIAITKLKEAFDEQLGFIKGILESVFVIGLELWERLTDEFGDDVIRIFDGIKEGINTAIDAVISILDSWLDTLIGIFDWLNTHIFRIVTEEETREPSVNTGGGGSGGSGGGGGGSGGSGGGGGDGPVIRATGGPVRSGRPYLVGELGPELFMPSRNGQIIPNHRLAQMTSGPMVRGGQVAAHIDNRESVVNFGDTYVSNGMDAATFEARIRAVVIKMMK